MSNPGGIRKGAGRKRIYPGGTKWVMVPLPSEVAAALECIPYDLREFLVKRAREYVEKYPPHGIKWPE